jgi:uncharacterized protein (UPF0332 family)
LTGENRKENVAAELAKANDALRAARTLIDAGLPNDAVSRSYYAAFHLLVSRGLEAKTHGGTMRLFNRELTKTGALPAFNKLLTGLQGSRDAADYDSGVSFTTDEANALLADAEAFRGAVVTLLQGEGWA